MNHNHSTRLCMWEEELTDGRTRYRNCIHLDGEFNVCKIHRPQFDKREQHSNEFLDKYMDNNYSMDEWKQILEEHYTEQGTLYPCDSNISGAEVDEMLHNSCIPSIVQRQYRTCDSCAWYDVNDEECLANKIGYINNFEDVMKSCGDIVPCRFHLTKDEICQILDPYFME